ncbi:MAG TPA: hypothetical protein VHB21_02020, partial [Minicystis sp.]|nr:hypothetical protein [Minicystis sp.]
GARAMILVKRARTLDAVVAGARSYGGRPVVGALLLGLYDDRGRLVHVGVVSQLADAERAALVERLRPLACPLEGHPWEHGFHLEPSPLGRLKGSAGRWVPGEMSPDFTPLRPELVCEIAYDTMDGARLRYPARLVRFRDDKDPRACGFDQLEPPAADVAATLAEGVLA